MDSIFGELKNRDEARADADFTPKEILETKKQRFEYLANRVYNLCIAYFEVKDLPNYISKFDEKIRPFISDKMLLISSSPSFLGEDSSALTQMFGQFLNAFPEFGSIDEKTGIDFLENILESTAVVLKEMNVSPTSEVQVYSSVKILCKATFPDAIFPTESFQKTAKCYKPDILIPILGCAVEYKYAPTEERLVTTIDEILIDVKGYDRHDIYKQFYAVFYVMPGHMTDSRFKQIWAEKRFPENWKGIFVLGN